MQKGAFYSLCYIYTYNSCILKIFSYAETCSIARSVLFSSWIDSSPLVKHNPLSNIPDGLVPKILSGAVRKCSGTCLGIGIMNNATIDYVIDGTGQPSRKTNLEELMNKMTAATEFVFPVMKPSFANDKFKFIELIKVDSVVVVEGQPLVNNVGNNISSSLSSLFTVLLCFIVFCFASGCVVWILVNYQLSTFILIMQIFVCIYCHSKIV